MVNSMIPISNTTIDNKSIFRKVNPAFKFIIFILSVLIFFIPTGFFGQTFLIVITISSLFVAKLTKKTYINLFRTFLIMLALFIVINWITVKYPIAIFLNNEHYNTLGSWSDFFCVDSTKYGYTNPSIKFTDILGDGKIATIFEVKNHVARLMVDNSKDINKWISTIDKNDLNQILGYMMPYYGESESWCKAMLYALNNEYTIDGIRWKSEILANLPVTSDLSQLASAYSFKGIIYNVEGIVTYSTTWYSIGYSAFFNALNITIKVTMIIAASIILTSTTTPSELTNGIEKLFSPLKILRFPANECALILSIGIRFIPSLLIESRRILNAQAARGLDFYNGNLWIKIKSLVSLIIPLFSISINRSSELANAMDARGYNPRAERTKYRQIHTKTIDYIYLFILILVMSFQLFLWIFKFLFQPFGIIEAGMVLK